MGDTALYTFLLPDVHKTGSIDLYGSWDNFRQAYPMTKDTQMGHGQWYGCHEFKNVICDGDPSNCTMPRDEPLKMTGTYWYYYKRDGDVEFHNPHEPSTNTCPLIPGQTVNVLTMPQMHSSAFTMEVEAPETAPGLTLDLEKRWNTPRPPRRREGRPTSVSESEQQSRDWWFNESLGRLQTAVVEHILSGFKSAELDDSSTCKPTFLPGRRLCTAGGATNQVDFQNARAQPRQAQRSRPEASAVQQRPQSRLGLQYMTARPSSSAIFANPFEDPSLLEMRAGQANSLSSTRPQTWMTEDRSEVGTDDEEEPERPLSAPQTKAGLAALFKLPQRSKTQVYRTNPNNRWRRGQILADGYESLDLADDMAARLHLDRLRTESMRREEDLKRKVSAERQLDASELTASIIAAEGRIESFRMPSPLQIPSRDSGVGEAEFVAEGHIDETKHPVEHDLWTPSTSSDKGLSDWGSPGQSKRTSSLNWSVQTPLSIPELSPPDLLYQSNEQHTKQAAAPTASITSLPSLLAEDRSERNVDFGASQETIKAPVAQQATSLTRSDSLSIGSLAFERTEEEASGGKGRASSELGDFSFLGFSIT